MKHRDDNGCPPCGGARRAGETTFSVELGFGVVIVRHVPATVCTQCGADWISDEVAARLETYIDDARRKHSQVEVVAFA
jgi:YgiT-type zinc finger domain-containing protein